MDPHQEPMDGAYFTLHYLTGTKPFLAEMIVLHRYDPGSQRPCFFNDRIPQQGMQIAFTHEVHVSL